MVGTAKVVAAAVVEVAAAVEVAIATTPLRPTTASIATLAQDLDPSHPVSTAVVTTERKLPCVTLITSL